MTMDCCWQAAATASKEARGLPDEIVERHRNSADNVFLVSAVWLCVSF
jgi:hypothetical protein